MTRWLSSIVLKVTEETTTMPVAAERPPMKAKTDRGCCACSSGRVRT